MSVWCEVCRDRFPESHFDEAGRHRYAATTTFRLLAALVAVNVVAVLLSVAGIVLAWTS